MPDINDLPKYSPWPSYLLGLKPFSKVNRTPDDLIREFDKEKWGSLLKKVRETGANTDLSKVEEWQYSPDNEVLSWVSNKWKITSASELRGEYLDWVSEHLKNWFDCESIVELGAGYGSVILNLAKRGVFGTSDLYAGEYTQSGIQLLNLLAEREGINIKTGYCDFNNPLQIDMEIPPESFIFTLYSAAYVSMMEYNFVETLSKLNPRIVVHIEPVYEHFLGDDLLSMMRRRYMEVNDYNRNLLSLLRECEEKGEIEIVREAKPAFGANPLLPASVLAWRPTY